MKDNRLAAGLQARSGAKRLSLRDAVKAAKAREDARLSDEIAKSQRAARPRAHFAIESLTATFRRELAREHADVAREAWATYRRALDIWTDEVAEGREGDTHEAFDAPTVEVLRDSANRAKWHTSRATGQLERFDRVRACGVRVVHAKCTMCGEETKPVPEGCGVRRVCDRCDLQGAQTRRARFGRARGRCVIQGHRYGLMRRYRAGGRYTEKMLTLTVPHIKLADCKVVPSLRGKDVRTMSRDDVDARIRAAWLAWPRFMRKLNRHWRARWEHHVRYHRAFEWTPASDGIGHPHFHCYLWSPFVDRNLVREWWAEALREVGVPVRRTDEGTSKVIVDIRMLRGFDLRAARELIKGSRRQALTLSRVEYTDGPGVDAFAYADGWTIGDVVAFCSPDVVARLYMALEARRLTQASQGFFADDAPPECPCCGSERFRVWFDFPSAPANDRGACSIPQRSPP